MSRNDAERLSDILEAVETIAAHLTRGDLADGLVFDAVRVRLIEIGEAVKGISTGLLANEQTGTGPTSRVCATEQDLPVLVAAVRRLQDRVR